MSFKVQSSVVYLGVALLAAAAPTLRAAELASGTISATQSGSSYNYQVNVTDVGTTPIGTVWLFWLPGEGFLPDAPTSIAPATGWTPAQTNGPSTGGYSVRWEAGTGAALNPGQSMTFNFTSPDSPSVLAGMDTNVPPLPAATPILTSFTYSGAPFADPGAQFTLVESSGSSAVPEPGVLGMVAAGLGCLGLLRRKRSV